MDIGLYNLNNGPVGDRAGKTTDGHELLRGMGVPIRCWAIGWVLTEQ
ncbi:MAG: hypothetical protein ACAF42_12955 [Limnothrix sp. BL-A-16]